VKGKKEPEVVYSIVGRDDLANSGRFQRWRELNMNMLSRYRSRDWAGALAAVEQGLAADEEQRFKTLYNIYYERIRSFQSRRRRRLGRRLRPRYQIGPTEAVFPLQALKLHGKTVV
jgi:hypothetical protein